MEKLTNFYYANYESSVEGECFFDSDNPDTRERLLQSPSQSNFCQYLLKRENEELLHEHWKERIHRNLIVKEIEEQCGMIVCLGNDCVRYVYKPGINETHIPGIKFKVTLKYVKLLRKWYISLGYTRVPEIINLENVLKKGTYNPVGSKVIELMRKVKDMLEIYVQRLTFIYRVIDTVKETYKDIEFKVNLALTEVEIILKEKGWPKNMEKTSTKDVILMEIKLDENLEVENLDYEYMHSKEVLKEFKEMYINKLEEKLKIFFDLPLMEAFEIFMNDETFVRNENFVEGEM